MCTLVSDKRSCYLYTKCIFKQSTCRSARGTLDVAVGRGVSNSASYRKVPVILTDILWFSSVPLKECQDSILS
jgi:hypothetical protein